MRLLDGRDDTDAVLTRSDLLAARRASATSRDWRVQPPGSTLIFRPFMHIHDEAYRVYQGVAADDTRAGAITPAS
jgi:hypothetical protein